MMRELFIEGVGFWSDLVAGWPRVEAVLAGRPDLSDPVVAARRRPEPTGLSAAERRRAPDSVCLAMSAAEQALEQSGQNGADLACVFASAHGDLGLTDYLCATVADDARHLSPTRFHNSVHNAPVGYWTMAVGCRRASTAVAAWQYSFGAGLLEALVQCVTNNEPVLFSAYDMAAPGLLAQLNSSRHLLALALVLSTQRSASSRWTLRWQVGPDAAANNEHAGPDADGNWSILSPLTANAMADCLPFCRAMAVDRPNPVIIRAGEAISLQLNLRRIE